MTGLVHKDVHAVTTTHAEISILDTLVGERTVVFIHGNSLCKEAFSHQFNSLGESLRLIAVDLPGHGASSDAVNPRSTYNLEGYADCVAEVLEAIGIARAVVVGWSLGGHIGLELSSRFAGLLGLMAIGTPPIERLADGSMAGFLPHPRLALSGAEALSDAEAVEFASLIGGFEGQPDAAWVDAVKRADGLARKYMVEGLYGGPPRRQRELAERCPVPLALVNGSADPVVDLAYIDGLSYRNLWSGRQIVIPGQGHAPHAQAAADFNRILTAFLDEVAPL